MAEFFGAGTCAACYCILTQTETVCGKIPEYLSYAIKKQAGNRPVFKFLLLLRQMPD